MVSILRLRALRPKLPSRAVFALLFLLLSVLLSTGCWAPLHSPGIPASQLPDSFRTPWRSTLPRLNLAHLSVAGPREYHLGANDVLEVTIPRLYPAVNQGPLVVQVTAGGEVHLPMIGLVRIGGLTVAQAQQAIQMRYADGVLQDPAVSVVLSEKEMIDVVVLGAVKEPGIYALPRSETDVAHALASAGGLDESAEHVVEVHRSQGRPETEQFLSIPLRGFADRQFSPMDVILGPGDVLYVPEHTNEVFYVVGRLNTANFLRFTVGARERELGNGLLLPRDRDIDVVTAVVMAGYIDPINSPTTVTVHRTQDNGDPMLITVDLIKARYDRRETIMVQPGDILYLNPDFSWWFRMTFDRVVPQLITIPYEKAIRGN